MPAIPSGPSFINVLYKGSYILFYKIAWRHILQDNHLRRTNAFKKNTSLFEQPENPRSASRCSFVNDFSQSLSTDVSKQFKFVSSLCWYLRKCCICKQHTNHKVEENNRNAIKDVPFLSEFGSTVQKVKLKTVILFSWERRNFKLYVRPVTVKLAIMEVSSLGYVMLITLHGTMGCN